VKSPANVPFDAAGDTITFNNLTQPVEMNITFKTKKK